MSTTRSPRASLTTCMAAASRWSMPSSVPLTSWSLPRLPWSRALQGLCAEPALAWHHSLGDRGRPQLRPAGGNGGLLRGDDGGGPADRRHLTIKRSNKYAHRSLIKLPLITSTRSHRLKLSSEHESISVGFLGT